MSQVDRGDEAMPPLGAQVGPSTWWSSMSTDERMIVSEVSRVSPWPLDVEVPLHVLQQLMLNGEVHPVVVRNGVILHAPGELNLGRATRLASRAQRRALRAMYSGCCVPGCSVAFDQCKIHHLRWWRHGGPTDLANLIPICSRHHVAVHDRGWVLELGDRRELTVRMPDGTIHNTGPPRRRAA